MQRKGEIEPTPHETAPGESATDAAFGPTDPVPSTPGTFLTPTIRLVRPLGDGGMARVWVAFHRNLRVHVAVKLLNDAMLALPAVRQRFVDEGPSAAKIKSPHVVQILDRGLTTDGVPFIVMELLEGETVQQRIDRTGRFSLDETRAVVHQTARALAKAHAAGVVHCDVKPDNLFLVDGEPGIFVKLLDFGIAKQLGEADASGVVLGTPEYMAPEQMRTTADVGVFTDVWGLGVATYQMLTGKVPFTGDDLDTVRARIEHGELPPIAPVRSDVPRELDAWLARALARDPHERFATMAEAAAAFDRACAASSEDRERTSTAQPIAHSIAVFPAPKPRRWLLPLAAALSLVASGTGFTWARASNVKAAGAPMAVGAPPPLALEEAPIPEREDVPARASASPPTEDAKRAPSSSAEISSARSSSPAPRPRPPTSPAVRQAYSARAKAIAKSSAPVATAPPEKSDPYADVEASSAPSSSERKVELAQPDSL